jgi:hypothetical protein
MTVLAVQGAAIGRALTVALVDDWDERKND